MKQKTTIKRTIPPLSDESEVIGWIIIIMLGLVVCAFLLKVYQQGWPAWISWMWGA